MPVVSAGCQPCRTRRVKCDETFPICKKCVKSKRECYGLRPAFSVMHLENAYASGKKKRPRGPRSIPTTEPPLQLAQFLPRSPDSLREEAVVYYIHVHLKGLNDIPTLPMLQSTRDTLLTMRSPTGAWTLTATPEQCQMLDLAVSCLALAIFSRVRKIPAAALEGRVRYHQLLRIMQTTLATLDKTNIEVCLLSIPLMSLYEDATHQPDLKRETTRAKLNREMKSFRHHEGVLALLKFWKHNLSGEGKPNTAVKHARRIAIKSALVRNFALPDWLEDGEDWGEHGLELGYDRLVARVARLRRRLDVLLRSQNDNHICADELRRELRQLNDEARDIDAGFQKWNATFPETWHPRKHLLPKDNDWPKEHFYSDHIYTFPTAAESAVWNRYYSTRMLLQSTRLNILQILSELSPIFIDNERLECLLCVKAMGDEIALTLPFALDRITVAHDEESGEDNVALRSGKDMESYRASLCMFPVTIASCNGFIDVEQRVWFGTLLSEMGRVMGFPIFEYAVVDGWIDSWLPETLTFRGRKIPRI
ncbi:hypothetical protein EJ04DRAFT_471379 [Polyplosphaeria fusca]|uniref:Zn(2)-C6 fungal-type domain-containing protein n=1 Tax=Polyplosphaeria fusca TaxID=682080 RepID=A0A9P4QQ75_9PLEO|nr:hypothetical protein EJ04DRAFT_471379 [Polyplosphaeria fusca]